MSNADMWRELNELEETLYQADSLLNVMLDGLSNDAIGVQGEDYSAVTGIVRGKVEHAKEATQRLFEIYRANKTDVWKEWEGETPIWPDDGEVELAVQDGDGESRGSEVDEEATKTVVRNFASSLSVTLKEETEDGGAIFEVEGSKEDMQSLFEAFFGNAIIRGVESAVQENGLYAAEAEVIKRAKELNRWLAVYEVSETLDYDPEVKEARMKLEEALEGMVRRGKPS